MVWFSTTLHACNLHSLHNAEALMQHLPVEGGLTRCGPQMVQHASSRTGVTGSGTMRASSRLPVRPGSESASSLDVLKMRWLSKPRYLRTSHQKLCTSLSGLMCMHYPGNACTPKCNIKCCGGEGISCNDTSSQHCFTMCTGT